MAITTIRTIGALTQIKWIPAGCRGLASTKQSSSLTVGFIGLGQMGFPMAANIVRRLAPQTLVVHDTVESTAARLAAEQENATQKTVTIKSAASPREVAERCSVVVTMLPAPQHVRSVYLGDSGILHAARPNSIFIDSSTIDPASSKAVASALKPSGALFVDAPVSGGTLGAQAGTLTFMVGAPSETDFARVRPILEAMGKNIVYCGAVGNGQVAKICNNMMLGISMAAAAETMNLGIRLGMDPKLLASIINSSSGRCWSTDTYNPCPGVMPNVPSSRDYEGGFGVSLMAKDMGLAVAAAQESKSTVILGSVANQIYSQISSTNGFEKKDFSSVFKWLNDNSKKF